MIESKTIEGIETDKWKLLHERFCLLVKDIAETRLAAFPDLRTRDWIVRCYLSIDEFKQQFPDIEACRQWLSEKEQNDRETRELISGEIEHIQREGLSYLDIEQLHYEFPTPNEDE